MTQTGSINSTSKAFFSGSTRAVLKLDLPKGTKTWYYRITTMDINTNYYYPQEETFFTQIFDKKAFTINNKTDKPLYFYIIDDNEVNNFRQTGNDNFRKINRIQQGWQQVMIILDTTLNIRKRIQKGLLIVVI